MAKIGCQQQFFRFVEMIGKPKIIVFHVGNISAGGVFQHVMPMRLTNP